MPGIGALNGRRAPCAGHTATLQVPPASFASTTRTHSMTRVFNFPVPARPPCRSRCWSRPARKCSIGTGMSVMEMSHRSRAFVGIAEQAENRPARSCWRCPPTTRCCSCRAARRCSSRPCRSTCPRPARPSTT